jgi:tetrahydromethanopterin S-methyltransferase subunit G
MEPLTSHRRSLAAVLLIMLVFGLGLAACGGSAGGTPAVGEPAGGLGTPDGRNSGGGGGADKGSVPFANLADLADRKIVKTGEITLEVPGVGAAIGDVRAMALSLGGYVSGSRAGGEHETATLTVRVPAARFDAALERLHAMDGEVRVEATNEEDVTSAIVDLDARIRNLQASEKQYRVLLGRAEKIDDILAVQSRLDDVRGQIEQLTAQLKQLNGQASAFDGDCDAGADRYAGRGCGRRVGSGGDTRYRRGRARVGRSGIRRFRDLAPGRGTADPPGRGAGPVDRDAPDTVDSTAIPAHARRRGIVAARPSCRMR